jgi:hypothetical protein
MVGAANRAGASRVFKSITFRRGAVWVLFVLAVTKQSIDKCPHCTAASQGAESQQRWWISTSLNQLREAVWICFRNIR